MKTKSVFFTLFFISLSVIGYAQDETLTSTTIVEKPKAKVWFGPKFGLDIAQFTTNVDAITGQLGSNYQAGLLCQIGETLYLQPELYYSHISKIGLKSIDSSYIKLPIMVGLKFLDIGLFSLHIKGGPQFRFPLDNTDKPTGKMNLDWQVGVGVDILGFITTDLRYSLQSGKSIDEQAKNIGTSNLNLTVGLKFR
ncbi:MAG: outer membrane beta-barrel protein [Paludibacter sp.]